LVPEVDDVEIYHEVELSTLQIPTILDVSEGFGDIRDFWPMDGLTWEDAVECLRLEKSLVATIASRAASPQEFGELAEQVLGDLSDERDDLGPEGIFLLDLGVLATVAALSAAGCVTASKVAAAVTEATLPGFASPPIRSGPFSCLRSRRRQDVA